MKTTDITTLSALGATVYIATLTDEDTVEALALQLGYKVDVETYKAVSRKREILGIRVLLQLALGSNIRIHYKDNRPYLTDTGENILPQNISVSHSRAVLAIALHPACQVGIDIEILAGRMARVRDSFLSAKERAWQAGDDERMTMAHKSWTIKEALYKIVGEPVYDFPNKIEIAPDFNSVKALGKTYPVYCTATEQYALGIVTEAGHQ